MRRSFNFFYKMKSPSSTIHVSDKGTVTVLAASLDAGECLEAYRKCTKPGTIFYSRMGHIDKNKKIESEAQIKAKADALAANAKARAKSDLIEAEAAAEATAETAKQAKAALDALKPKPKKATK